MSPCVSDLLKALAENSHQFTLTAQKGATYMFTFTKLKTVHHGFTIYTTVPPNACSTQPSVHFSSTCYLMSAVCPSLICPRHCHAYARVWLQLIYVCIYIRFEYAECSRTPCNPSIEVLATL